jgi:hypothetical protein
MIRNGGDASPACVILKAKEVSKLAVEVVEHCGVRYAEIIRADTKVEKTRYFSPPGSSFQFGLLAHEAGFAEPPHRHKPLKREIYDLQQMLVMQRGVLVIELFTEEGDLLREVTLRAGDAIVLVHGIHGVRVIEDFQAISVKQGPYFGASQDKIEVEVKT